MRNYSPLHIREDTHLQYNPGDTTHTYNQESFFLVASLSIGLKVVRKRLHALHLQQLCTLGPSEEICPPCPHPAKHSCHAGQAGGWHESRCLRGARGSAGTQPRTGSSHLHLHLPEPRTSCWGPPEQHHDAKSKALLLESQSFCSVQPWGVSPNFSGNNFKLSCHGKREMRKAEFMNTLPVCIVLCTETCNYTEAFQGIWQHKKVNCVIKVH